MSEIIYADPTRGKFEDHPGHKEQCELKERIIASPYGTSSNGYRCYATGGHCIPDDFCAERIEEVRDEKEIRECIEKNIRRIKT